MNMYTNILVAVDGSSEAKLALLKSIDLLKHKERAKLHIVHIIDIGFIGEDDVSYLDSERQRIEELLTSYKLLAKDEGVDQVEVYIKNGDPKETITKEIAPFVKTDLIVCGAQGIKNAEHYFLGSVSEAIVLTASCDVWISRKK
ncbi:universal stress protein [Sporosarcina sp. PTS2304]|uniref:universal stress protein n=1 Tax=Sporosarcina sp. PTS2304 TaxID=2283194 RepID=UPI000E0DC54F|nr:universal stress protein [Sporosarcina sp. PTS2304]AXI00199.1 universal stress protein [Sporosarcina sp. PTS2304]